MDYTTLICPGIQCLNFYPSTGHRIVCEHISSIRIDEANDLPVQLISIYDSDIAESVAYDDADEIKTIIELSAEECVPLLVESSESPRFNRHLSVYSRNSGRCIVTLSKEYGWKCQKCSKERLKIPKPFKGRVY